MPEWVALAAAVCAGGMVGVSLLVSAVMSRSKMAWLPGFNRASTRATVGVRRSATQAYVYYFFVLCMAAASYTVGLRGTASYGLSPGAAAGADLLPADENIYPLSMVALLPIVAIASARVLLVVETGALDILAASLLNGGLLFIIAQISDGASQASAFLTVFYWLSNLAVPVITWQLSTTEIHYMHGLALGLPVLVSTAGWFMINMSYSFGVFSVHGRYYFAAPFVSLFVGIVGLAVVFLASVRSRPRREPSEVGFSKSPDHHHHA